MNYRIYYDNSNDIIHTQFNGNLNKYDITKIVVEILEQAVEYECYRFLNDYRKAQIYHSVHELYNPVDIFSTVAKVFQFDSKKLYRAVVYNDLSFPEQKINADEFDRPGINVRFFMDFEAAQKWLIES